MRAVFQIIKAILILPSMFYINAGLYFELSSILIQESKFDIRGLRKGAKGRYDQLVRVLHFKL